MTMKELSQLHWLNVEIDRDKQRLAELEARAASPGGPNMSCLLYTSPSPRDRG